MQTPPSPFLPLLFIKPSESLPNINSLLNACVNLSVCLPHPSLSSASPKALAKLRRQVRRTKEVLSANSGAPINVEELANGLDFSGSIKRDEFESLAGDFWSRAAVRVAAIEAAVAAWHVHTHTHTHRTRTHYTLHTLIPTHAYDIPCSYIGSPLPPALHPPPKRAAAAPAPAAGSSRWSCRSCAHRRPCHGCWRATS